jgi:hypothetical protein
VKKAKDENANDESGKDEKDVVLMLTLKYITSDDLRLTSVDNGSSST